MTEGHGRVIRAVVAEDSGVTREYLVALLTEDPELSVVGTAQDGVEAVEQVERLRPDVVLMDIHMPRLDGLEATRRIMEEAPTPIVLVSASLRPDESTLSFEALKAGALTQLDKPPAPGDPGQPAAARELVRTVKLMAGVKVVRRSARRARQAPDLTPRRQAARRVAVIAIGASTGGPAAIAEVLEGMGDGPTPPVLVVQHMTPGFTRGFVEWLGHQTRLRVKLAEAGELACPGTVYVAPDSCEMGIGSDARLRLQDAPGGGAQPTVAHLFDSIAESFGSNALAILLTGMGRDGATELGRLRRLGAETVAQDQASSVVFGMPGEAARIGAAAHSLAPSEIALLIRSLTAGPHEGS
jgi:two-component system chemotaxis response regulator CheB